MEETMNQNENETARFPLGDIYATPGALEALVERGSSVERVSNEGGDERRRDTFLVAA